MATAVTATTFDRTVLEATVPTLVDFWAPWCPPCRQLMPTIERIASASDGSYNVVKVNVDDEPELATRYGIQSLPTVVLFRDGEPVSRLIGLQPESRILELLGESTPATR